MQLAYLVVFFLALAGCGQRCRSSTLECDAVEVFPRSGCGSPLPAGGYRVAYEAVRPSKSQARTGMNHGCHHAGWASWIRRAKTHSYFFFRWAQILSKAQIGGVGALRTHQELFSRPLPQRGGFLSVKPRSRLEATGADSPMAWRYYNVPGWHVTVLAQFRPGFWLKLFCHVCSRNRFPRVLSVADWHFCAQSGSVREERVGPPWPT
jgi:hypothetical protein